MLSSVLLTVLFTAIVVQYEVSAFMGAPLIPSSSAPLSRIIATELLLPAKSLKQHARRNISCLNLSGENSEADLSKKIEGRKKRVIAGYRAIIATYFAAGILTAKASGLSISLLRVLGGYLVLPTGLSYILISAAENNRLGSDTYKRMNLALFQYGVLGSLIVGLGKGRNKILALALLLSIINSVKGYTYGVLGWDKMKDASLVDDIFKGTIDTMKGFLSLPKYINSFGYLAVTTMMAALKLQKLVEVVKFFNTSGLVEGLAMPLAQFNRLALVTLSLYTLKDAADRKRLGGTTFIELNLLCALSLGVHAAFFMGEATFPLGLVSTYTFFSLFCAFNGIREYIKKN